MFSDLLRVPTDGTFELASVDPRSTPGLPQSLPPGADAKQWARTDLVTLGQRCGVEQEKLYAQAKVTGDQRRVLIVLQAMDCGGKDGTVRHVIGQLNPQGLQIRGFGPPTERERREHFLWRIRGAVPEAGYIGVFNRSHYEDVLIARVRQLVPDDVWRGRYDEINAFEHELTQHGVTLLKVMLHISPQEQLKRLAERLRRPDKRWKYNPGDIDERAFWPDYQSAYQDALARCSTADAPWHVVPADRKWYRDWAVARLLGETLDRLALRYPEPDYDVATEQARLTSVTRP